MNPMQEAAYRHLLSLLPPGRYPREGGAADGMVRMLGGLEGRLLEELFRLVAEAFPQSASEEGLGEHARARAIRRLPPDEPLESWRARVIGAMDWWRWAGTRPGMERELARLGVRAQVIEGPFENFFDGTWHFGDYEGAFTGPAWAEFLLRIWPQGPFQARERAYLRAVVAELKPAHAVLRGVELRAEDIRHIRLQHEARTWPQDYGAFGHFVFGEVQRVSLLGGMSLEAWAEGRNLRSPAFDGWSFGEVGF
ncbi:phage tail protein [Thermus tengchongensis]|uniref:phage tail protein n=1 Tax=Thermus tengchongensis TaxID=1214928 RepID=UPI001F2D4968|nr:phage tail protein [Thermus tengchongensis]